jgi:hypothetical protein
MDYNLQTKIIFFPSTHTKIYLVYFISITQAILDINLPVIVKVLSFTRLFRGGFLKLMACMTSSQTWFAWVVREVDEADPNALKLGVLSFMFSLHFKFFDGLHADIIYFFLAVC